MPKISIPNWITLIRLCGIPLIFVIFYRFNYSHPWWTADIFLILAITDFVDGYLARRLNQVTNLGKFLDPLVDKLLVMAPLLLLVETERIPTWGVFIILARELTIAGWRVNQTTIQGASIWGKLKTVSQIAAIAVLLAPLPANWSAIGTSLFWIAVSLTLISASLYFQTALQDANPAQKHKI